MKKKTKSVFYFVVNKKTKHVFCVTDNISDALKACVNCPNTDVFDIIKINSILDI